MARYDVKDSDSALNRATVRSSRSGDPVRIECLWSSTASAVRPAAHGPAVTRMDVHHSAS